MKFKVITEVKQQDGSIKKDEVQIPALTEKDANLQLHFIKENTETRYGKNNVVSVRLTVEE